MWSLGVEIHRGWGREENSCDIFLVVLRQVVLKSGQLRGMLLYGRGYSLRALRALSQRHADGLREC